MTFTWPNFTAWCIQVAIVVGVGALLPALFRLGAPRPRLVYWHLLLLLCLALPVLQPYRPVQVLVPSDVSFTTGPMQIAASQAGSAHEWTLTEIALGVLATGIILRLAWLAIGLWRLRRYRNAAVRLLPLPDEARRVIGRLGVHADFYLSEDVISPVTFGARNPVVMLPAGFLDLPPEKREPVICHELLHVQRNDWLFAIGEEIIRSLLWFHPAVWWLLGRIQLTREQVVDQSVIEHTNAPDEYVDALIAIAATRLEADLAPAPLFLKKHHLRQRVASIVRGGVSMSKRNLLLSTFAVFSALPLVVGITAWQFPLNAAPQEVRDGDGVEVKGGPFKILHRTPVYYPVDARQKGIGGGVVVSVSLNSKGEVADAKVVSGTEELRKAVLSSVLNWHFSTDPWLVNGETKPVPQAFEIAVVFNAGPGGPVPKRALTSGTPPTHPSVAVDRVDLSQLPQALRERVSQVSLPREGEVLTPARMSEIADELHAIDEHISISGPIKDGKVALRVYLNNTVAPASGPVMSLAPDRIKVGGNEQASQLVTKITPSYPPLAKQSKVQGTVRMTATIDKEGHVINLEVVSGHPLLVESALEAVRQWVYKPTLLNGNPVEVVTTIDVNYTLAP